MQNIRQLLSKLRGLLESTFSGDNRKYVVYSILLAVATWFFIVSGKAYTYEEEIPVVSRGLSQQNRILLQRELPRIRIRILGRGWLLWKELLFGDAYYDLDFSGREIAPGRLEQELQPDNVVFPLASRPGEVVIIAPRRLELDVDRMTERRVRVLPLLTGKPAEGYKLVTSKCVPDSVLIAGPRSVLDTLLFLTTDNIHLNDWKSPREITTALAVPFNYLRLSHRFVTVQLEIEPLLDRDFVRIPVIITHAPRDHQVLSDPRSVTVTLRGGAGEIQKTTVEDLRVHVDFRQWRPEAPYLDPEVEYPDNLDLVRVQPGKIKGRMIIR